MIGNRLFVQGHIAHIYLAWRIKCYADQVLGPEPLINIVEIGGGYGGLCYWVHMLCKHRIASYAIVDLPSTNAVQAYFLSNALGSEGAVALFDRNQRKFDNDASIRLLPHTELRAISENVDIVVNQDSFPELPEAEVDRYLSWIAERAKYFVSLNQEAYAPVDGVPQVLVPARCTRQDKLQRISRMRSWVRNGYVEEFYYAKNP